MHIPVTVQVPFNMLLFSGFSLGLYGKPISSDIVEIDQPYFSLLLSGCEAVSINQSKYT